MDKLEIISLHKRCNKKARKISQSKNGPFKSDEPKKLSGSPGPIDDPSEEEQGPKKASRPSDGKKAATKAGKKVKKTSQSKKARKSPKFIASSGEEEEGPPKDDKEKKIPPLLGVKEEAQSFFDLRKGSKNLTIEKKAKKGVFMREPYVGYELSRVALDDTKYLRGVLKMSGLDKKTKDLIKQALAKT